MSKTERLEGLRGKKLRKDMVLDKDTLEYKERFNKFELWQNFTKIVSNCQKRIMSVFETLRSTKWAIHNVELD